MNRVHPRCEICGTEKTVSHYIRHVKQLVCPCCHAEKQAAEAEKTNRGSRASQPSPEKVSVAQEPVFLGVPLFSRVDFNGDPFFHSERRQTVS